jgi:membrane-bound ClpP family serine protease
MAWKFSWNKSSSCTGPITKKPPLALPSSSCSTTTGIISTPPPQALDLQKAILAFFIVVGIVWMFYYYVVKNSLFGSLIVALIIGFILLNLLFFPNKINTFAEFNNSMAFYIFIQTFTPLLIYVFAFYSAVKSTRKRKMDFSI